MEKHVMPADRKVLNHDLGEKAFGRNFDTIPFRSRIIQFFKFDMKVSLSSITPLNSKFSSIKSGRNNLSKDAVADGISIKWYKNAKLYF
ncbi:hypothetical protein FBD94_03710 [Pedobacter hiemivivus]|uniref:Uncharacterized protein n=1 Tax=Pedobacter hiemivivus TaxID=2530454 RepID=A0A4V5PDR2_9SPHI|nr:hypothetical protein [Pedobacter hiemivivus]TKC65656.1 hypothetical protein FBD94_03710 [Pedobacter hiemivivus]